MWHAAPGISASPSEENLRYFNVMILGPQQSCYEGTASTCCPAPQQRDFRTVAVPNLPVFAGGAFKLELFLPEDYPMAAPKVCITFTSLKDNTAHLHLCGLHFVCIALQSFEHWLIIGQAHSCSRLCSWP